MPDVTHHPPVSRPVPRLVRQWPLRHTHRKAIDRDPLEFLLSGELRRPPVRDHHGVLSAPAELSGELADQLLHTTHMGRKRGGEDCDVHSARACWYIRFTRSATRSHVNVWSARSRPRTPRSVRLAGSCSKRLRASAKPATS